MRPSEDPQNVIDDLIEVVVRLRSEIVELGVVAPIFGDGQGPSLSSRRADRASWPPPGRNFSITVHLLPYTEVTTVTTGVWDIGHIVDAPEVSGHQSHKGYE